MSKRLLISLGAVTGIALTSVVVAHAASTLDQEIEWSTSDCNTEVYSSVGLGQSFTAGLSGPLVSVQLLLIDAGVGSKVGLVVQLSSASSNLPTGAALATAIIPDSDVSSSAGDVVTVSFSSPATVTAGQQYSILLTTIEANNNYKWCGNYPSTYSEGSGLDDQGGWRTVSSGFSLRTYVDVPSVPSVGSSSAVPASVDVNLGLSAEDGSVTSSWAASTAVGTWKQLPESSNVVGAGDNLGKVFLGVATSEDFPVEIAQRQVDNGWGAYEIYSDDGRLSSVFIPAGGRAHVTAQPRLFPMWGE